MTDPVLKLGCRGETVKKAQSLLKEKGFLTGNVDGVFGPATQKAVRAFQRSTDDVSDGIIGERTWSSLRGSEGVRWKLRERDYDVAARELNCEVEAIKAVSEVESAGGGFLDEGIPKILFERHWMFRKLDEYNLITALKLAEVYIPHIVNKTPGGYEGGYGEWNRFNEAYGLNHECAIEAASWGRFQCMGFHWRRLGYDSPEHFREDMEDSEAQHLDAFVQFIKADVRLLNAIQKKDWKSFAYAYNGVNFKINNYDGRMKEAYERLTK